MASAGLWVRGHRTADSYTWESPPDRTQLRIISTDGAIVIAHTRLLRQGIVFEKNSVGFRSRPSFPALPLRDYTATLLPGVRYGLGQTQYSEMRWLAIRAWLICLSTFLLPVWWAKRYWMSDGRRAHGQCPTCGYDLRATPERCPECGTAIPAHAAGRRRIAEDSKLTADR